MNRVRNRVSNKTIILMIIVFSVINILVSTVAAKTSIPYDYTLDSANNRIPIPKTYECVGVISNISDYFPDEGTAGSLNSPADIFIDATDNIYIADSNNNAVLKLNPDGELVAAVTAANGIDLKYPLGLYVDNEGDIYVADNGNKRILHLDGTGDYVEEFIEPKTSLINQELAVFDPTKIAMNSTNGYLYMILGKQFLTIDANNKFRGFIGSEKVSVDLAYLLFQLLGSETQKVKVGKRQPVPYNNFHITKDNDIYAVSMSRTNQIKQINSIGNNIYNPGFYGEMSYEDDGTPVYPFFVDVAVSSNGIITLAEQHSNKLYQYDNLGNLLTVFGGTGDNKGRFGVISSIAYDSKDRLYVVDSARNNIQIFEATTFIKQVQDATILYNQGRYDESMAIWKKVNLTASNYPNALSSIAKINFKQKNYKEALTSYFEVKDKTGYGKVIEKLRFELYLNHFTPIALLSVFIIGLLLWLLAFLYRKCEKAENLLYKNSQTKFRAFLRMCLLMFFHPVRALDLVKKHRDERNMYPVILLPLMVIIERLASILFTNFTVSSISPGEANLMFEVAIVIIPYLSLAVCVYGILSILSGEMKFYEGFAATAYSLTPFVVLTPLMILVSRVVSNAEASIFYSVQKLIYLWVVVLIVTAVYRLNNISVRKTALVCLLSIAGVAVIWVVALLIFAFTSQIVYFIKEINLELIGLSR
ncbi:MAG: YIP1 family protein [Saccharofermentanales bacterium]